MYTAILGAFGVVVFFLSFRVAPQWEKCPVFRLGKVNRVAGPGWFFIIPVIESVIRVDTRVRVVPITAEDALTADGVPISVKSVVMWSVNDAERAVVEVEDYEEAVERVSGADLLQSISATKLAEVISQRLGMDAQIKQLISTETTDWGVTVRSVRILDIELPEGLQRAMSQTAQAEREQAARVTVAEAEKKVAVILVEAARTLAQDPGAMELRRINAMVEMSREGGTSTVFIPTNTTLAIAASPAAALVPSSAALLPGGAQPSIAAAPDDTGDGDEEREAA